MGRPRRSEIATSTALHARLRGFADARRSARRRRRPAPPSCAPSRTRWGSVCISVRSFRLAGSPSAAFTTTIARRARRRPRAASWPWGSPRRRAHAGRRARSARSRATPIGARDGGLETGSLAVYGEVPVEAHRAIARDALEQARQRPGDCAGTCSTGGSIVSVSSLIRRSPCPNRRGMSSVMQQRDGRAGTSRPVRSERATGQPDQQEQRESTGAAQCGSAASQVLGPAVEHAHDHRCEHRQQARDAKRQQPRAVTSLPVPKPCSNAIGQLA